MDLESALAELNRTKVSISEISVPNSSGVYAICLRHSSFIEGLPTNHEGLLYIGSASNLAARGFDHHFNSTRTSFSSLRRSLGALLKQELNLVAIPRGSGLSEDDFRHYKFLPDGEERLTKWMEDHLEIGICPVASQYESLETQLIARLKPILNLIGWDNPYRRETKRRRKICAEEARRNYSG